EFQVPENKHGSQQTSDTEYSLLRCALPRRERFRYISGCVKLTRALCIGSSHPVSQSQFPRWRKGSLPRNRFCRAFPSGLCRDACTIERGAPTAQLAERKADPTAVGSTSNAFHRPPQPGPPWF